VSWGVFPDGKTGLSLLDPLLESSLDLLESLLNPLLKSSSLDPLWTLLCSTLYWNLLHLTLWSLLYSTLYWSLLHLTLWSPLLDLLLESSSLSQSQSYLQLSVSQSDRPSWPWAPPSLCLCVSRLYVQAMSRSVRRLSCVSSSLQDGSTVTNIVHLGNQRSKTGAARAASLFNSHNSYVAQKKFVVVTEPEVIHKNPPRTLYPEPVQSS
jgi:hypothetical protein